MDHDALQVQGKCAQLDGTFTLLCVHKASIFRSDPYKDEKKRRKK